MTSIVRPASHEAGSRAGKRAFAASDALDFVREHGVVLVSARGRGPNLVEAIAGEPVKGSWWAHADGKRIFSLINAVTASEDVLVCRLIDGKITLVHRRLWPALVRVAEDFPPERIAQVREEHTASGRHVSRSLAFPDWVSRAIAQQAEALDKDEARALFAAWMPASGALRHQRTSDGD